MVTLVGLTRTFATTNDFYAVYSLKRSNKRSFIRLRNGSKFNLVWSQFRTLRDSYPVLKKYAVEQLNDDVFRMHAGDQVFRGSSVTIASISELLEKYHVEQQGDDIFRVWNAEVQLTGSDGLLYSMFEIEKGVYDCDSCGKVVLDIGGFEGESAVYFASQGASKVVVYEPVPVHEETIHRNMEANRVNAEVHIEGIGEKDGTQTISYTNTSLGFGVLDRGDRELEIRIADVSRVVEESGADVAKIDCEGAEESLVNVSADVLRKVDFYMIEVHSRKIREEIVKKFESSGFRLTKEYSRDISVSMVYFSRVGVV